MYRERNEEHETNYFHQQSCKKNTQKLKYEGLSTETKRVELTFLRASIARTEPITKRTPIANKINRTSVPFI